VPNLVAFINTINFFVFVVLIYILIYENTTGCIPYTNVDSKIEIIALSQ
jgi:hypothetical protein